MSKDSFNLAWITEIKQAGDTIGINRLAVDTAPTIETPFRDLAIAADLPFQVKGRSASSVITTG